LPGQKSSRSEPICVPGLPRITRKHMYDRDSNSVIFGRPTIDDDIELDFRSEGREYLEQFLSIYEEKCPDKRGKVHNISEHGLGLIGIPARVNEIKTFVVESNDPHDSETCRLVAVCRWVKPEAAADDQDSGFEIVQISQEDWKRLLELVPSLNIEEKLRNEERYTIDPPIPVYEIGEGEQAGYVVDVSRHGFRIMGLKATPGEHKKLILKVGEDIVKQGIEVEAICRWMKPRDPTVDFDAGFEITNVSGEGFQKFVEMHPKSRQKY